MGEAGQQRTVIGPDTSIKGEMVFEDSASILGTFEGRITAKRDVFIGEGAVCRADVEAESVQIDGVLEGNAIARERIQLNATARVQGDLISKTLVVAEGATVVGQCRAGVQAEEGSGEASEGGAGAEASEGKSRPWGNQAKGGAGSEAGRRGGDGGSSGLNVHIGPLGRTRALGDKSKDQKNNEARSA